ncbi:MAG: branched-chain amino acid transport system permease protein [Frankiaceae bacterium]|jgi:branched-subunit amino acid ABC-type transport system permease component|nr:branched-chain amino acid transport system permease protein [Frankiaceae bacterium]
MSGGVLLQSVLSGLSIGAIYGLVAMGFTLVWSLTRVLALAHGDVVVASALVAVLVVVGRTPVAIAPDWGRSLALVVVALVVGVALSLAVYAVAVRPFLDRSRRSEDVLGWVAGGVTAGLVVRTALGLALPAAAYAVPDPLHLDGLTSTGSVSLPGGGSVGVRVFPVLGVALAIALATGWFVRASRAGRAMRAVADDVDAATLCGVPVERTVVLAFVLAGLLAAVAGLLDAPGRSVAVDSGVVLGLAGAAAALLGRLGSPSGAVAGGLVLGVAQQLVAGWPRLGASWAPLVPLAALVVVLAVRPDGLRTGRPVVAE